MGQVHIDKEEMRNFFLNELAERGFTPRGVKYLWWPNNIENIFASNKSPYLNPQLSYSTLSLYEILLFCVYSGAAFTDTLEYTPSSYDYFHCIFKEELYGVFCKLLDYIKNNKSGKYAAYIENQFSENAINLYECVYNIIKEYFSSKDVEDLPFKRNMDGSLSAGFFVLMNRSQVFKDMDAIGANLYQVGRSLRTGERNWPGISSEHIVSSLLRSEIRRNVSDLKAHIFFCLK